MLDSKRKTRPSQNSRTSKTKRNRRNRRKQVSMSAIFSLTASHPLFLFARVSYQGLTSTYLVHLVSQSSYIERKDRNELMTYDPSLFEEVRSTGTFGLTASWDQNEREQRDLVAPGNSIICIPIITVISITSASYRWRLVDQRTVRVWMHAWGSQTPLDQWRGWVDLRYELVCSLRRSGVADHIAVECPPSNVDIPIEGGTTPYEGGGVETHCQMLDPQKPGVLMCIPYNIKDGNKIYGMPYPCGVCFESENPG